MPEVRKSQRGWYARCYQHQFQQPADDWRQALMLANEHASHLHDVERTGRLLGGTPVHKFIPGLFHDHCGACGETWGWKIDGERVHDVD